MIITVKTITDNLGPGKIRVGADGPPDIMIHTAVNGINVIIEYPVSETIHHIGRGHFPSEIKFHTDLNAVPMQFPDHGLKFLNSSGRIFSGRICCLRHEIIRIPVAPEIYLPGLHHFFITQMNSWLITADRILNDFVKLIGRHKLHHGYAQFLQIINLVQDSHKSSLFSGTGIPSHGKSPDMQSVNQRIRKFIIQSPVSAPVKFIIIKSGSLLI